MGTVGVLQLVLMLLKGLVAAFTESKAPQEVIDGINRAIEEISKVHGTVVTKTQIDLLLDTPKW